MAQQEACTIIADIRPEAHGSLETLLAEMGKNPGNNAVVPFATLPKVHFARFLILPDAIDLQGQAISAKLVLSTNVDGSAQRHLLDLASMVPEGLDAIFGHCVGYPPPALVNDSSRRVFLEDHMVQPQAFYVNTVGRTLLQVRQEDQLHSSIEDFVDKQRAEHALQNMTPSAVHALVRRYVSETTDLRWAIRPAAGLSLTERVKQKVARFGWPLVFAAVGTVAIPLFPFYLVGLRCKEITDAPDTTKPTLEQVHRVSANEDVYVQNPFSGVGPLKAGLLRSVTARVALRLLDYASKYIYNNGRLTGVTTIHFARWILIDSGRRVLFMSNYDGSLESYMSDFIDKVAWGLNLVFSNGVGWPKTSWLVKGGAKNEMAFKNFLRSHELPTQVYYSAYPDLTAVNIANNAAIRRGLTVQRMTDAEARDWLKLL